MAGRQLRHLDGVQLSLKLSGGSWQTSTGKVFHSLIALGKKVLIVHACVALDLSVAGFEPWLSNELSTKVLRRP